MPPGSMFALLIGASVLQGWHVGSIVALKTSDEDASSAVLNAAGAGHLVKKSAPDPASSGDNLAKPLCDIACAEYKDGVTKDNEVVTMDPGSAVCGDVGDVNTECTQRFEGPCPEYCSQFANVDSKTIDVCLHNEVQDIHGEIQPRYRCSSMTGGACGEEVDAKGRATKAFKCAQKTIENCPMFCEGYLNMGTGVTSADGHDALNENSELVCQNTGASDNEKEHLGLCMPLPCSYRHHNSASYLHAQICRQTLPPCPNSCQEGSPAPTGPTVCFNTSPWRDSMGKPLYGGCSNIAHGQSCPQDMHRCTPILHHMNYGAEAKESSGFGTSSFSEQNAKGESLVRRERADETK